ncbi:MAG TPA: hypothetical protein VGH66_19420, partial [Acidimicrobiales bacterium]
MRRSTGTCVLLAVVLTAAACSRSNGGKTAAAPPSQTTAASSGTGAPTDCTKTPLQATEVGVTPTTITVETMADVGSPLAPGLFQGNFDAMNAYATYINAHGGIGCRK